MLHGVWHFSFTVSDLDRSIEFYRDLLGFELVHTQEQANAYTRRLVGYPDASLRVAQFAVPGQPRGISTHDLELVQYLSPKGERGSREICNPGAAHMAMTVDDIRQAQLPKLEEVKPQIAQQLQQQKLAQFQDGLRKGAKIE